jgi:VWFA-related protein
MRTVVLFAGVVAVSGLMGHAEQAPVYRGGVSLASVDVSVLDRDGHPVPGLTAEDLEVKLDGKVRPVRALVYDAGADRIAPPAAAGGTSAREVTNAVRPPDDRLFVILLDDLSIAPSRGKGLFFAASRFVDGLRPSDVVGMTTSSGTVTVNPTRDHAAIGAALRHTAGAFIDPRSLPLVGGGDGSTIDARTGAAMDATVGLQESMEIAAGNGGLEQVAIRRDCFAGGNPTPEQLATSLCAEQVERQLRNVGAVARRQGDEQLQAYLNVINAMRPAPGLKSLVVVSDGIALAARDQRVRFEALAQAAAASGVALSVLVQEPDLVSVGDRSAAEASVRRDDGQAMLQGIQTIADLTGGNFYRVIGTPDPAFAQVALATSAVYHLGVEAPDSNPGRDFALAARVTRPNLTVHANRHAVAPGPVVTVSTDDQLRAGVARGALAYGVPLSLATVIRRGQTPSQIDLGANVAIPAGVTGPLTVMFGLVDATGTLKTGRTVLAPPTDGGDYRVSLSLPVAPGPYHLRFAVADAAGHVGSLGEAVHAELARLGPFLASDLLTSWTGADGQPRFLALEEVPTTATGLRAFLELYPASSAPMPAAVRVHWSLIGDGPQPLGDVSVAPVRAADRLTAAGQFRLESLAPGPYELRATVLVDDVAVGTTSTIIRKVVSPAGRTYWVPVTDCSGTCLSR